MEVHLVKPLKLWEYWEANTHTKFLNEVFGTNFNKNFIFMKGWFKYSEDTIVWFGYLDGKARNEFINTYVNKDTIKQKYVGKTDKYDGKQLNLSHEYDYRLVFEIVNMPSSRRYIFNGLYKLDRVNSTPQFDKDKEPSYELVFKKVSDVFPVK